MYSLFSAPPHAKKYSNSAHKHSISSENGASSSSSTDISANQQIKPHKRSKSCSIQYTTSTNNNNNTENTPPLVISIPTSYSYSNLESDAIISGHNNPFYRSNNTNPINNSFQVKNRRRRRTSTIASTNTSYSSTDLSSLGDYGSSDIESESSSDCLINNGTSIIKKDGFITMDDLHIDTEGIQKHSSSPLHPRVAIQSYNNPSSSFLRCFSSNLSPIASSPNFEQTNDSITNNLVTLERSLFNSTQNAILSLEQTLADNNSECMLGEIGSAGIIKPASASWNELDLTDAINSARPVTGETDCMIESKQAISAIVINNNESSIMKNNVSDTIIEPAVDGWICPMNCGAAIAFSRNSSRSIAAHLKGCRKMRSINFSS